MALFDHTIITEVQAKIAAQYESLGAALGYSQPGSARSTVETNTPLLEKLMLLIEVANGERSRTGTSKAEIEEIKRALDQVQTLLLGNALQSKTVIPDEFWQSRIGVLFSRVIWWLYADDLITISNAAALAFAENSQANRMRIVRAIDRGVLDWVPDPSIANPQHNRCVYKFQAIRLGEERSRPNRNEDEQK